MQRVNIKDTELSFGELSKRMATDQIVIHHTGNPYDDDLSAEEIHASHRAQGWAGIGYHYVIRKSGAIEAGRPHWTQFRDRRADGGADRIPRYVACKRLS